jgi:hypothetical protein
MQSRDHDEITGRPILGKDKLVDGRYYKGRCRNATIARWNSAENSFYHSREKFRAIFIETIRHPTDESEPGGTFLTWLKNFPIRSSRFLSTRRRNSAGNGRASPNLI